MEWMIPNLYKVRWGERVVNILGRNDQRNVLVKWTDRDKRFFFFFVRIGRRKVIKEKEAVENRWMWWHNSITCIFYYKLHLGLRMCKVMVVKNADLIMIGKLQSAFISCKCIMCYCIH